MNRQDARKISETITNQQLSEMFQKAKVGIKDWTAVSKVNKGMTKGSAWNVLASKFDVEHTYHIMGKINMIREFGEYLPDDLKPKKKTKRELPKPHHQDPIF
jgi:hypothetical protein